MADSTNSISLQVVDAVSPDIAPKLIKIADASDRAAASVGTLADAFATLKGAGLGSLSTMLDKMETSTLKAAVAQTTLNSRISATVNSTYQLANAQGEASAALQATTQASRASQAATIAKTVVDKESGAATTKLVSANISAAAGLGILEGRTLSMNRAAANFVTRILGLGPLLQQAFVVIGAVAMVAVLAQMAMGLVKVYKEAMNAGREIAKAFDSVINPLRKTNDELQLTNDKLDATLARLQHRPTTNGAAMALDEARVMADKLDDSLEHVSNDLDTILRKNQVGFFGGLMTNQATTKDTSKYIDDEWKKIQQAQDNAKDALDKAASLKDPKAAAAALTTAYQNERAALKDVTQAIIDKYNATKKLNDTKIEYVDPKSGQISYTAATDQTANLTELGKAGHLAQQELRNLDLTMENLQKNKAVDNQRDSSSSLSAALRQERKDWEALTASFDRYQASVDKAGHKPTAQQSLAFLQSQKVSGGNVDKLAAKELPFQNKIAGDSEWMQQQTDKLANQVNEIGLYDDALKEAAVLRNITQDAQRRGISLTNDEIAGYKEQIARIVESRDYQKALQTEYDAVNHTRDEYVAKFHALNDLLKAGEYTQDQYNQAVKRTVRDYAEASNAVVAFQRKLEDQKRDAGNKLGSNQDIAVKAKLQTLAEAMRNGDATHPGGYSESEITAALNSKRDQIKAQLQKNEVDEAANKLIFQQTNLYDQLIVREKALTEAVQAGVMSQQAANSERLKDWNQQNDMQLKSGTGGSSWKGALADYASTFTTVAAGIKESLSSTFKTLADGIADSIGRAIAGAKNLGQALKDVAKQAVGELISSLIKLAIEYFIIDKLQKALHIKPVPVVAGPTPTQAAEGVAGMAAITVAGMVMTKLLTQPMWSLAAAMAGVTFGMSAVAGASSIAALGAAEQAAAAPKLAIGTNYVPQDMLAFIHKGEAVVPAAYNPAAAGAAQQSGQGSHWGMKVEVHNHNGSRVEVEQMDEQTVRLIVRDEAPGLIARHAPKVIASELVNPNSKVSKAQTNNTYTTRRR